MVGVQAHYDSAHVLRKQRGRCERLHGHRYVVEAALVAPSLDEAGVAFDLVEVKRHLRALAGRLDHEHLNELVPFTDVEPTAENQARYFYEELKRRLPGAMREALLYVRVWETPTRWAQYSERPLAF